MKELRNLSTLAIFVLVVPLVTSVAGQQSIGILAKDAPLFLYPDASREPLLRMEAGVQVKILRVEGLWLNVTVDGSRFGERTGYVEAKYVALASRPQVPSKPSDGSGSEAPRPTASASTPIPASATVAAPTSKPVAPSATVTAPPSTPTAPSASVAAPKDPQPPVYVPVAPRVDASVSAGGAVPAGSARLYTNEQLGRNIQVGAKGKGRIQGLQLVDTAQRFFSGLSAAGNGATGSNGFSVIAYTPLAWVRQLASDAAKEYRTYTVANVSDEALEPVFRVVAYPDTPNTVTAAGMRGTASVQHVVLRDESRKIVVQPTFKESFTEETSNAMGGRATFEGIRVKFAMSDVRELRGPKGDREFFITVVGNTGEEKDFRVKKKHFDDLP